MRSRRCCKKCGAFLRAQNHGIYCAPCATPPCELLEEPPYFAGMTEAQIEALIEQEAA